MRRRRGFALGALMAMLALMVVLALAIAAFAVYHLTSARTAASRYRAREAAEAGLARAAARLAGNSLWGQNGESVGDTLPDGSTYAVTFQAGVDQPYSVNNLTSPSSVAGYQNQAVAAFSALVVCRGATTDGQSQVLESVLQPNPYPYALAASGVIQAQGPLDVRGAASADDYLAGDLSQPADVYAGSSNNPAVSSGAGSYITGKVESVGTVALGPGSQVLGGIQTVQPQGMPQVNIALYEPPLGGSTTEIAPGKMAGSITINGPTRVEGGLQLNGNITMNASTLFVAGDLDAHGHIEGTGSVFATGKVSMQGHVGFSATRNIAVFAGNGIDLKGGSVFQGALYSPGNIVVSGGMDVVGSVISSGGDVLLGSSTRLISLPQYSVYATGATAQYAPAAPLRVVSTQVCP